MTAALIGIAFGIGIPLLTELLRFDKRTIGALTLTAIAFIYIGFVTTDFPELYIEALGALVFFMLGYVMPQIMSVAGWLPLPLCSLLWQAYWYLWLLATAFTKSLSLMLHCFYWVSF